MIFSDPTEQNGIVELVRERLGVDADAYPIKQVTNNVNKWYEMVVNRIQKHDAKWQWDDSNATTLPIETYNLVAGQPDYELNDDIRSVERIEIKQENSDTSRVLRRLHDENIQGSIDEVFEQDNEPIYYDLLGRSVYLYPTPNYSQTNALKMWVRRAHSPFVSTDTTKEPGFDSIYHHILVEGAAYEYAKSFKPEKAQVMYRDATQMLNEMEMHYKRRGGRSKVRAKQHNAM